MGYLVYDLATKVLAWTLTIIYIGIIAVIFFIRMTKAPEEPKSQKAIFRSTGFFFVCYIMIRIFFLLSDFERDAKGITDLYSQYVIIGYTFGNLAFLNIIAFAEKYLMKKGRYLITYIIIIFIGFNIFMLIFFPYMLDLIRLLNYALNYTEFGIILFFYLFLIFKTTGQIRKNAATALFGLAITGVGIVLEMDILLSSGLIPPYLSPILFSIGITIFAYAQKPI
ncbi:MAG: hypothetical protein ACTSR8_00290 [Promethearchaeota archaeon]